MQSEDILIQGHSQALKNLYEVFTNSKIIADMLEVAHKDLLRTIEKVVNRQKNNRQTSTLRYPQKFIESSFTNKMGRTYKEIYKYAKEEVEKLSDSLAFKKIN